MLILGGYISAHRYALVYVRKSELEALARDNHPKASQILELLENKEKLNLRIQVIQALFTIMAAVIGAGLLCDDLTAMIFNNSGAVDSVYCHWIVLAGIALVLAFLRMFAGETFPRRLAEHYPLKYSLAGVSHLRFWMAAGALPSMGLSTISGLIIRMLRLKKPAPIEGAAEEKIINVVDEAAKTGEFDVSEQALIKSVLEFSDTIASHCMTPRTDISAINIDDPSEQILRFVREEGYSRYPVFKDDLDHIEGIVYTRDIINMLQDKEIFIIHDLLRRPYFVPDSKKISELLKDFQARQSHMAIVLDEFGGTAGIITIEDILEEIVGEIQDEYDEEELEYRPLGENRAEVHAGMDVDDFNERFGADLPEDVADTIGGLIFTHLGELPVLRQKILIDSLEFNIISIQGNRIEKVMVRRTSGPQKS